MQRSNLVVSQPFGSKDSVVSRPFGSVTVVHEGPRADSVSPDAAAASSSTGLEMVITALLPLDDVVASSVVPLISAETPLLPSVADCVSTCEAVTSSSAPISPPTTPPAADGAAPNGVPSDDGVGAEPNGEPPKPLSFDASDVSESSSVVNGLPNVSSLDESPCMVGGGGAERRGGGGAGRVSSFARLTRASSREDARRRARYRMRCLRLRFVALSRTRDGVALSPALARARCCRSGADDVAGGSPTRDRDGRAVRGSAGGGGEEEDGSSSFGEGSSLAAPPHRN